MTIGFELGKRVFLPAKVAPYTRVDRDPKTRALWMYSSDPGMTGSRQPVLRVDIPYEPLKAGPSGSLFHVEQRQISDALRGLLGWSQDQGEKWDKAPFELDNLALAISAGMSPTTGDPNFAAQMTYAVCQQTYEVFRRALGRNPCWGSWVNDRLDKGEGTQLRIIPCSFKEANAYYDPNKGTLEFGYFTADDLTTPSVLPGGLVMTALSADIVAHELTHAILDGMRAEFMRDTHIDVAAFHEAFADIVALLQHFSRRELVEQALSECRGDVNSDLLLGLGQQFGEAINGELGGALRRALGKDEGPDSKIRPENMYSDEAPREAHDRGSILVSAVFEAFLRAYRRRTEKLMRIVRSSTPGEARDLPRELIELLAQEAQTVAGHFLRICIRAIDYCPPVDLKFGTYLRALITADTDAVPEDAFGYRDAFILAFRRRNISIKSVRDLSQDSLRWRPPDMADTLIEALSFKHLRFTDNGLNQPSAHEVKRRAEALGEFILAAPERLRVFGVHVPGHSYGPITIQSIRLAHRIGPDDIPRNDLVAEVTQQRHAKGNTFVGGATVIVGMDGKVRYVIRRRIDDLKRRHDEMKHAGPAGAQRLDFRKIHAGRLVSRNSK